MNELSFALEGHPTRGRILEAALKLFSERGYDGTAVPAITAEAGIAAGTMYRHFSGKEDLVNELFRALCLQLEGSLRAPSEAREDAREWYGGLWSRLFAFGRAFPRAYEFIEFHHHASYLSADARGFEHRAFEPFLDFFDTHSEILRPIPSMALLAMVRGMAAGLLKAPSVEWPRSVLQQCEEAAWQVVVDAAPLVVHATPSKLPTASKDWRVW